MASLSNCCSYSHCYDPLNSRGVVSLVWSGGGVCVSWSSRGSMRTRAEGAVSKASNVEASDAIGAKEFRLTSNGRLSRSQVHVVEFVESAQPASPSPDLRGRDESRQHAAGTSTEGGAESLRVREIGAKRFLAEDGAPREGAESEALHQMKEGAQEGLLLRGPGESKGVQKSFELEGFKGSEKSKGLKKPKKMGGSGGQEYLKGSGKSKAFQKSRGLEELNGAISSAEQKGPQVHRVASQQARPLREGIRIQEGGVRVWRRSEAAELEENRREGGSGGKGHLLSVHVDRRGDRGSVRLEEEKKTMQGRAERRVRGGVGGAREQRVDEGGHREQHRTGGGRGQSRSSRRPQMVGREFTRRGLELRSEWNGDCDVDQKMDPKAAPRARGRGAVLGGEEPLHSLREALSEEQEMRMERLCHAVDQAGSAELSPASLAELLWAMGLAVSSKTLEQLLASRAILKLLGGGEAADADARGGGHAEHARGIEGGHCAESTEIKAEYSNDGEGGQATERRVSGVTDEMQQAVLRKGMGDSEFTSGSVPDDKATKPSSSSQEDALLRSIYLLPGTKQELTQRPRLAAGLSKRGGEQSSDDGGGFGSETKMRAVDGLKTLVPSTSLLSAPSLPASSTPKSAAAAAAAASASASAPAEHELIVQVKQSSATAPIPPPSRRLSTITYLCSQTATSPSRSSKNYPSTSQAPTLVPSTDISTLTSSFESPAPLPFEKLSRLLLAFDHLGVKRGPPVLLLLILLYGKLNRADLACSTFLELKEHLAERGDDVTGVDASVAASTTTAAASKAAASPAAVAASTMTVASTAAAAAAEASKEAMAVAVAGYEAMMDAFRRNNDWKRSLQLHAEMKSVCIQPTRATLSSLVATCTAADRWQAAKAALLEMIGSQLLPSAADFTNLIAACARAKQSAEARELLALMARVGVHADVAAYSATISACGSLGEWEHAMRIFAKMRRAGVAPNVVTWTALIGACAAGGRADVAMEAMRKMTEAGEKGNAVTWTALIGALGKEGRWEEAERMVEEMTDRGVEPNEITWGCLTNVYASAGQWRRAMCVPQRMRNQGLQSHVAVWNACINACNKAGRWKMLGSIMEEMKRDGCEPTVVTFGSLIKGYGDGGQIERAEDIFDMLLISGIRPNSIICSSMIRAYARSQRFNSALQFFDRLPELGVVPDKFSFTALLWACGFCGRWRDAPEIFEKMKRAGCVPDAKTYQTLINTYEKHGQVQMAMDVFENMGRLERLELPRSFQKFKRTS